MFVHDSIKDEFTEKIVNRTKKIKVGHPADPNVQMGAMISEEHLNKVLGFVQSAKDEVNAILLIPLMFFPISSLFCLKFLS